MSIKEVLKNQIESSQSGISSRIGNGWSNLSIQLYLAGVSNTFNDLINELNASNLITDDEQEELTELLSNTLDKF